MAYVVSKGTILEQKISGTFTAVAQVETISLSGAEAETYELRPLDASDAGVLKKPNGWASGGTVTVGLIYDPALAGHQSITDIITTPARCDWRIKHADGSLTATTWTSGGVGFDEDINGTTGVKATVRMTVDGLMAFPT